MRAGGRVGRPQAVLAGVAVACAVALIGSYLLPWAHTGNAERNAFALARAADALGLADTPLLRSLLVGFWISPLLLGGSWVLAVLGRYRAAGAVLVAIGSIAVCGALVVADAPLVRPAIGWWVGIVLGGSAVILGGFTAVPATRSEAENDC